MSNENKKITVLGFPVTIKRIDQYDYINLSDIAKSESNQRSRDLVRNWLKNQKTLLFLATWEHLHNPNFKGDQMDAFRLQSVNEGFNTSPKKYIEQTNAMGLVSRQGREGGTFGHIEIALSFAYWLNPSFQVYFLKEFNRLKEEENFRIENTKKWAFEKVIREAESVINAAELGLMTVNGETMEEWMQRREEEE